MAYAKGEFPENGLKAMALRMLGSTPTGLHMTDIASTLKRSELATANALYQLAKAGLIIGVRDDDGKKAHLRKRYCLPQYEAACRAVCSTSSVRASRWCKTGLGATTDKDRGAALARAQVTVCQSGQDFRFSLKPGEQPERFFSRPGYRPDFIGQDTAIARYLAGAA